jgi:DNA-binding CsgD family transcriptional regulator
MGKSSAILDTLRTATDTAAAVEVVRSAFNVHAVYHLAHTPAGNVDSPFVRTTYPAAWVSRYLLASYVKVDPIVRAGLERVLPFDWSEVNVTPEALPMMRDAQGHGLGASGYTIPVIDRLGRRALFSVNATSGEEDWREFIRNSQATLIEVAHAIHQIALKELYGDAEPPRLTAREREVLTWTARGKDYKAVAQIIGISHHTTKAYLKSARYKLDCTSNAQVVAKATSLRLISD